MPRAVALNLLASAVTVLAAIAFLGVGLLVGSPPLAGAPRAAAIDGPDGTNNSDAPPVGTEAVVRQFYVAVNVAIHTGDVAALDAIVAPDAVINAALPGGMADKPGLIAYVAAIHATQAAADLAVDAVSTVGDEAITRISARGSAASFLERKLDAPPPVWGRHDAFRVAGDRVIELWSDLSGYVVIEPLGRAAMDTPYPTGRDLVLEWVRLRPDQAWRASPVPRAVAVVAGRLAIAVDPWSAAAPVEFNATVGEAVVLPTSGRYVLRQSSSSPNAAVIALTMSPVAYEGPPQRNADTPVARPSPGLASVRPAEFARRTVDGLRDAIVERFASGPASEFASGQVGVSFGRVTVGPGGTLRVPAADGVALLGIESGRLAIMTEGGAVKLHRGNAGPDSDAFAASGRLVVGDGAYVPSSVVVTLHNPGPEPAVALAVGVEI